MNDVPIFLRHSRVNTYGWKVALHKKLIQLGGPINTLDEYDDLVKVQRVKEIIQLPVLFQLTQFDVVLSI